MWLSQMVVWMMVLAGVSLAHAQQPVVVNGVVLDPDGKPAAKCELATFWMAQGEQMQAYEPTLTGADGKFSIKVQTYGRPAAVMAMSADRKLAAILPIDKDGKPASDSIKLAKAVRVQGQFTCSEAGVKPSWTNVYLMTDSGARFLQCRSDTAAFSFLVPPGKYNFWGYGKDIKDLKKELVIDEKQTLVDMKSVEMKATEIAKHKGKAPPAIHVTDARGAKREFQLADYKGKWVLIDFFTHWCGPCVASSIPNLIELYDEHKDHRDKFEIIAVHVEDAKDFADYDAKIKSAKDKYWGGKELPFPLLLDATDKTIEAYGIRAFPTTILIDPDGKLIGEVTEDELVKHLPPIPITRRLPKALDKQIGFGFDQLTLAETAQSFSKVARIPIKLDEPALKAMGISPGDKIPFKMVGQVSLRSWLNLILDAYALTYKLDDAGLVIVPRDPKAPVAELSSVQKSCAQRIDEMLGKNKDFDLKESTLDELCQYFETATGENFVLDPVARKAGRIDPMKKVSGAAKNIPLREGLTKLLDPLGLKLVVRDEVVVITTK